MSSSANTFLSIRLHSSSPTTWPIEKVSSPASKGLFQDGNDPVRSEAECQKTDSSHRPGRHGLAADCPVPRPRRTRKRRQRQLWLAERELRHNRPSREDINGVFRRKSAPKIRSLPVLLQVLDIRPETGGWSRIRGSFEPQTAPDSVLDPGPSGCPHFRDVAAVFVPEISLILHHLRPNFHPRVPESCDPDCQLLPARVPSRDHFRCAKRIPRRLGQCEPRWRRFTLHEASSKTVRTFWNLFYIQSHLF